MINNNISKGDRSNERRDMFFDNKSVRDKKTILKMIEIFCRANHKSGGLCGNCAELFEYASERIEKCRFGVEKPVCSKCPVHCYKKEMREKIIEVMRFAGPKMVWKHPLLAVFHLLDRSGK